MDHSQQRHDDLLIPPELLAEKLNAMVDQVAQDVEEEAKFWEKELRKIDRTLRLVFVEDHVDEDGLTPGRYHVIKKIPGALDEAWPLVGPDGEFRVPGAWMVDGGPESFQALDLWNPRVHRSKSECKRRFEREQERARNLAAEQRRDEIALGFRAGRRLRGNAGFETTFQPKRDGKGIKSADRS